MKKIVVTGLVVFFAFIANAQVFKKGDVVEINKNLSNAPEPVWLTGKIIDVDGDKKQYVIRGKDNKLYNIPFIKEGGWIRRPVQPLKASMAVSTTSCSPTIEFIKQKIQNEFENDFSEYDSVTISYNSVEPQASYKNNDPDLGKTGSEVYPFKVDLTVRLVTTYKDGTQRKINWQFKRKYLLFQDSTGNCELTMAEREENLLSNI